MFAFGKLLTADVASMFMVKDPARFEAVMTSNLFGDILTDLGTDKRQRLVLLIRHLGIFV